MPRWMGWVLAILLIAGIIGLVAFARGEPGRQDIPEAAVAMGLAAR